MIAIKKNTFLNVFPYFMLLFTVFIIMFVVMLIFAANNLYTDKPIHHKILTRNTSWK